MGLRLTPRTPTGDTVIAAIGPGWLVLLGVGADDTGADAAAVATKILHLRAFHDDDGKMNRSVLDGGAVLLVSQFRLYGDCRQGRRPSFTTAAPPALARALYEETATLLRAGGVPVELGQFQAHAS